MKMSIIMNFATLFQAFEMAGEELVIVGGAVRDLLLGSNPKDVDFSTSALPEKTTQILEQAGFKVFPLGIEFGTVATIVNGLQVEITTYRPKETYIPGSRKPEVKFGKDLVADLARRDLSMNAMALRSDCTLVDPFNGKADMEQKILQVPVPSGEPADLWTRGVLMDDPLRILRIARFAGRLRMQPSSLVTEQAKLVVAGLADISRERWKAELDKMTLGASSIGWLWLSEIGALQLMLPKFKAIDWAAWQEVANKMPKKETLRWAALLSIARMEASEMKSFRWSNAELAEVAGLMVIPGDLSTLGLRRWIANAQGDLMDILEVAKAISVYHTSINVYEETVGQAMSIVSNANPVPVLPDGFGRVLMADLGLRGVQVGNAMTKVKTAIIDGNLANNKPADYYVSFLKENAQ